MSRQTIVRGIFFGLFFALVCAAVPQTIPSSTQIPGLKLSPNNSPQEVAGSLQILAMLTVLSLAPALLVMTTAFTRIIVVFSFLRNALGTPSIPPNQVLIGLCMFLTFYVMAPTFDQLNQTALQPYMKGEIKMEQAKERAWDSMRSFMIKQTYKSDLTLFANITKTKFKSIEDVGWQQLIPAFILSELKTAFIIGFYIFVPFLVIDLVVASTLMSMGMMMLPPAIVSLPAKILVFLLADGWSILVQAVIGGFR